MGCSPSKDKSTSIKVIRRSNSGHYARGDPSCKVCADFDTNYPAESSDDVQLPNATDCSRTQGFDENNDVICDDHNVVNTTIAHAQSSCISSTTSWSRHVKSSETGATKNEPVRHNSKVTKLNFQTKSDDPLNCKDDGTEQRRWLESVGHGYGLKDGTVPVEITSKDNQTKTTMGQGEWLPPIGGHNYSQHHNASQTNNLINRSKTMTMSNSSVRYNVKFTEDIEAIRLKGRHASTQPAGKLDDLHLWRDQSIHHMGRSTHEKQTNIDSSPMSKDSQYYSQGTDNWSVLSFNDKVGAFDTSSLLDWSDSWSDSLVIEDDGQSMNSLSTEDTLPAEYKLFRQRNQRSARPNAAVRRRSPNVLRPVDATPLTARFWSMV